LLPALGRFSFSYDGGRTITEDSKPAPASGARDHHRSNLLGSKFVDNDDGVAAGEAIDASIPNAAVMRAEAYRARKATSHRCIHPHTDDAVAGDFRVP
jgi:hypothetical protein